MKNTKKRIAVRSTVTVQSTVGLRHLAAILAVTVFACIPLFLTGCNVEPEVPVTADLAGNVTITPTSTSVTTGMELTAVYSGTDTTVTWQWNKGGEAISGETNETYTPALEGSYTVTASASGYNSKTSAAVTVAASNLAGNVTVSPSGTSTTGAQLTASYDGSDTAAVTWHWNKDGVVIPSETNATYTPTVPGSYTATASAPGYNAKTSAAVVVSYPDLPGSVAISPGPTSTINVQLTASYSGGGSESVTWQWSKDDVELSGETNATYTPTLAGSYTATASAPGYNAKTSAAVVVSALPNLEGDVTISPSGTILVGVELTADYDGTDAATIDSWQWNKDGVEITSETNVTYTPDAPGSYTVTANATGYNPKTSEAVTVIPDPNDGMDGTSSAPWKVWNAETLGYVGKGDDNPTGFTGWTLSAYYDLIEDITLDPPAAGQSNHTRIGKSGWPGGFEGTFDGKGHSITSIVVVNTGSDYDGFGFFGAIDQAGTVQNLALIDVSIVTDGGYVGGLAGMNGGKIQNCFVSGTVTGVSNVGGIVGTNGSYGVGMNGRINYTYTRATVTGTDQYDGPNTTGGVVGSNVSGNSGISNSVAMNEEISCPTGWTVPWHFVGDGSSTTNCYRWIGTDGKEEYDDYDDIFYKFSEDAPWNLGNSSNFATLVDDDLIVTRDFWEDIVGFDFDDIWDWDGSGLPVLKKQP